MERNTTNSQTIIIDKYFIKDSIIFLNSKNDEGPFIIIEKISKTLFKEWIKNKSGEEKKLIITYLKFKVKIFLFNQIWKELLVKKIPIWIKN